MAQDPAAVPNAIAKAVVRPRYWRGVVIERMDGNSYRVSINGRGTPRDNVRSESGAEHHAGDVVIGIYVPGMPPTPLILDAISHTKTPPGDAGDLAWPCRGREPGRTRNAHLYADGSEHPSLPTLTGGDDYTAGDPPVPLTSAPSTVVQAYYSRCDQEYPYAGKFGPRLLSFQSRGARIYVPSLVSVAEQTFRLDCYPIKSDLAAEVAPSETDTPGGGVNPGEETRRLWSVDLPAGIPQSVALDGARALVALSTQDPDTPTSTAGGSLCLVSLTTQAVSWTRTAGLSELLYPVGHPWFSHEAGVLLERGQQTRVAVVGSHPDHGDRCWIVERRSDTLTSRLLASWTSGAGDASDVTTTAVEPANAAPCGVSPSIFGGAVSWQQAFATDTQTRGHLVDVIHSEAANAVYPAWQWGTQIVSVPASSKGGPSWTVAQGGGWSGRPGSGTDVETDFAPNGPYTSPSRTWSTVLGYVPTGAPDTLLIPPDPPPWPPEYDPTDGGETWPEQQPLDWDWSAAVTAQTFYRPLCVLPSRGTDAKGLLVAAWAHVTARQQEGVVQTRSVTDWLPSVTVPGVGRVKSEFTAQGRRMRRLCDTGEEIVHVQCAASFATVATCGLMTVDCVTGQIQTQIEVSPCNVGEVSLPTWGGASGWTEQAVPVSPEDLQGRGFWRGWYGATYSDGGTLVDVPAPRPVLETVTDDGTLPRSVYVCEQAIEGEVPEGLTETQYALIYGASYTFSPTISTLDVPAQVSRVPLVDLTHAVSDGDLIYLLPNPQTLDSGTDEETSTAYDDNDARCLICLNHELTEQWRVRLFYEDSTDWAHPTRIRNYVGHSNAVWRGDTLYFAAKTQSAAGGNAQGNYWWLLVGIDTTPDTRDRTDAQWRVAVAKKFPASTSDVLDPDRRIPVAGPLSDTIAPELADEIMLHDVDVDKGAITWSALHHRAPHTPCQKIVSWF